MAVVVYHLTMEGDWGLLAPLFSRGYLGVEVFFVISGFVIAHSVRGAEHTPGYLGRFAFRRALRLDPPYWATIALEVGLIYLGLSLIPSLATDTPTVSQLVSHLFYAQNLTGHGDILAIFWTLCFEVQFYLFFVGCLVSWRMVKGHVHPGAAAGVLAALYVFSLLARYGPLIPDVPGLAHERWFQFFLGALTYWCITGRASYRWLAAAWVAIAFLVTTAWAPWEAGVVLGASGLLVATAATGRLGTALDGRVLQYLGSRSYSIYLIHLVVGARAAKVLEMIAPVPQWIVLAFGIAASLIASELLWRAVERPSIGWSKRAAVRGARPTVSTGQLVHQVAGSSGHVAARPVRGA